MAHLYNEVRIAMKIDAMRFSIKNSLGKFLEIIETNVCSFVLNYRGTDINARVLNLYTVVK